MKYINISVCMGLLIGTLIMVINLFYIIPNDPTATMDQWNTYGLSTMCMFLASIIFFFAYLMECKHEENQHLRAQLLGRLK